MKKLLLLVAFLFSGAIAASAQDVFAVTGTMNSSPVTGTVTMNSVNTVSSYVKVIFCSAN